MAYDDVWRILSAQNLTVASSGGAATSTSSLTSETYVIQLNYAGLISSTSGVYVAIGESPVAASTTGTLVSPNFPVQFKVTPGQKVSAISADAAVATLNIAQLTK